MEHAQPVSNRQEPVPVLKVTDEDAYVSDSEPRSRSAGLRRAVSPSRFQEKVQDKLQDRLQDFQAGDGAATGMQDRLFGMLFKQIFPEDAPEPAKPDRRSSKYVQRPEFSLPIMSRNFKRFNSRIGVIFVFQNRLIRLFSWKDPTKTLSFLAALTFCCLDPGLLAILPLAVGLLFMLVPAFITRHPPPPDGQLLIANEMHGPASALPPSIKPAPEMSKDFWRNMRDLQNCMEDFSVIHDRVVGTVAPTINFSDERLSSTIFLGLSVAICGLFLASKLLPWRLIFLFAGWLMTCSTHPELVRFVQEVDKGPIKRQAIRAQKGLYKWMAEDIVLDAAPEKREVEMFELQHRQGDVWESWIYALSPYTPRSPLRLSGDRPRGTRFFEDVKPPKGWEYRSKKWTLDLLSREWVEGRMITAVEVETGGDRWVYDIHEGNATAGTNDEVAPSTGAEWRRRRWVRTVQRKAIKSEGSTRHD